MAVFTIPSGNIPASNRTFGPFTVNAQWNRVAVQLDSTNLVDPISFVVEYAPDGVNYILVMRATQLSSELNGVIEFSFKRGDFDYATGQVRILVTNTSPWQTNGGTVTVELL
jgi:hypothetical protein